MNMDKREAIIFTAARLIHEQGYNKVGIKSILDELSIPKGSFYHYFKSKEDLGLSIIDIYIDDTKGCIESVSNDIKGLKDFFGLFFKRLEEMQLKKGCPVGNLILELSDENESFRTRLMVWYEMLFRWIEDVLTKESIDNAEKKAKALVAAFEGTMMLSKLDKDNVHFEIFNEITFCSIIEN
jgi:TetR/AcrR family transcriptional repressor of nem operon